MASWLPKVCRYSRQAQDRPNALDELERELILDALKFSRGNMAKAARSLGVSERVMGIRVRKHGIEPKRFRTAM
jgi:Nif-specific regulatory protein